MSRRKTSRKYYKRAKSWTQKFKDYLRQFIAFLFSNVGIICLVFGYTVAGALLFRYIETCNEDYCTTNTTETINLAHNTTVDSLWIKVSSKLNPLNETQFKVEVEKELLSLQRIIINEVQKSDYDGELTISDRWTISASSLYCLTVITTIGYGNVAPRTPWGKAATVVYAIFGMPLFLLYLSNIGDLLAKSFKWLYAKICLCKMCRTKKRFLHQNVNTAVDSNSWRNMPPEHSWQNRVKRRAVGEVTEGEESDDEVTESSESSSSMSSEDPQDITVPISLCLAIMIGYISSGAFLFAGWEGLNFRDGSYFCFISLSTIGFGDIVPTTTSKSGGNNISSIIEMNFIFCSIYLMLGMALIAMCFNLMQQDVVQKIRTCTDIVRRIARCRS